MEKFKVKKDFQFVKRIKEDESYFVDVDGFDGDIDKLVELDEKGKEYSVEMQYGRIDWEVAWELREYGIKYMDIYLSSMSIELVWYDDYEDEIITKTYTKDDFEDCEVNFDVNFSDRGNRHAEPTNILLDFQNSKITLDIY